jgi:hypothetical protein
MRRPGLHGGTENLVSYSGSTGSGRRSFSWVDCSALWRQVLTQCVTLLVVPVLIFVFEGVTWGSSTSLILPGTCFNHQAPQRFDGKMPVYPLPGHRPSVSPLGQCSGMMTAGEEDTLMYHVSHTGLAYGVASEASGYGDKVLFTSPSASQCCRRWPAFARLLFDCGRYAYPEGGAPLGWGNGVIDRFCSYRTSKSGKFSTHITRRERQHRAKACPPLWRFPQHAAADKFNEHPNHIHAPQVAQAQVSFAGRLVRRKPQLPRILFLKQLLWPSSKQAFKSGGRLSPIVAMPGNNNGSGNSLLGHIKSLQQSFNAMRKNTGKGKGQQQQQQQQQRNNRLSPHQMMLMQGALMRSIPKAIMSKEVRYHRGAPSTSHTFAPRGHGYYDAFVNQPDSLCLASQVGPCTPVEGFTRVNLLGTAGVTDATYTLWSGFQVATTAKVTDNTSLLIFNPGASDMVVAQHVRLVADGANIASVKTDDISILAFADFGPVLTPSHWNAIDDHDRAVTEVRQEPPLDPAGRIESIPVRGSMRIRNITENFGIGGEVRIMRYNGGLNLNPTDTVANPQSMSVKDYLDICDMLRDTKRALSMDGHELKQPQQSNSYPADHVRSMTFKQDNHFNEAVMYPSYCTIIVLVDNFKASQTQVNNSYSVAMTVQRAARFKPGTLLHSKSISPPADAGQHSTHAKLEALKPAAGTVAKGLVNAAAAFGPPPLKAAAAATNKIMNFAEFQRANQFFRKKG